MLAAWSGTVWRMARNVDGVRIGLTEAKGERTNQENQAQETSNESAITHEAETRSVAIDRKLNNYSETFL
jgi:hypothetical protein